MAHEGRAGQETRPYKAISVLGDAMATTATKPRLSLWNQTGLLKPPYGRPSVAARPPLRDVPSFIP